MDFQIVTGPTVEPIPISTAKRHLNLDSETLDGNLELTQSLPIASHAVSVGYTHLGVGTDILGSEAEVLLHAGTNGAGATNDTKVQESDDDITYTDWVGGAFAQVTDALDNADYKLQYTGYKQFIRTASKVLVDACEFGTSILVNASTRADDDLLTEYIQTAREGVEGYTGRGILTQTWDYFLDSFPGTNRVIIPLGNLQSVTSMSWKDTDAAETIMVAGTDYLVETNGDQCGRIVLPYSKTWPSDTLYPSKPIKIRIVCGWLNAGAVPSRLKAAILLAIGDLWENRESQILGMNSSEYQLNKTAEDLIRTKRLWEDFDYENR